MDYVPKLCAKSQNLTKPLISQINENFKKQRMMISTPLRSKILSHTRSSSLPSRSHPLIPQFNEHLRRLKELGSDSSTPSSLSSITKKLHTIEDLYNNCVDDLLRLPHTRKVFAHEKWSEEILDGYLRLVDACATAKDFISHSKEYALHLLSFLRRKRDNSESFCGFWTSRKVTKKMIHKSLRNITGFKNKPSVLALDKDQETIAIISMLKEAESMTLDVIEALLLSVAGAKGHSRPSGWCLVSRLMQTRKISDRDMLEFAEMDGNLCRIVSLRTSKSCDVNMQIVELQQQLRDMDASIRVVEERLESLFKCLIKTRVSLLNMQSQ